MSKRKASVSIANSRTRKTLNMPFSFSSNSTDTKRSQVSDKLLAPGGSIRKTLTQDEHWPIETTKIEPQFQLHYWATENKYRA